MAPLTSPLQGLGLLLTGGRKRGVEMDLSDWPRMAFVYLLAVLSSFLKPRWTPIRTFPILQVRLDRAMAPDPKRVSGVAQRSSAGKSPRRAAANRRPRRPQ